MWGIVLGPSNEAGGDEARPFATELLARGTSPDLSQPRSSAVRNYGLYTGWFSTWLWASLGVAVFARPGRLGSAALRLIGRQR